MRRSIAVASLLALHVGCGSGSDATTPPEARSGVGGNAPEGGHAGAGANAGGHDGGSVSAFPSSGSGGGATAGHGGSPTAGAAGMDLGSAGMDLGSAGTDMGSAGMSLTAGAPGCPAPAIAEANARGGDAPAFVNASTYDYSPSVMLDGNYRMWWCCGLSAGVAGDHVCHAEAASLDGPWHAHGSATPNTYDDTFHGTGNGANFDGTHTCDPSVIRVGSTYYMYYGGISEGVGQTWTRIGVATSTDGLSWSRLNGGNPIIDAARNPYTNSLPNNYGAGQPSVTYVDGLFYVTFTDTTGLGGNQGNGAGQYVLRSADPTFQTGVEELATTGFVAQAATTHTGHSYYEAYGSDLQYVDALDAFALNTVGNGVEVHLFDKTMVNRIGDYATPAAWTEEPALASRPDKHALPGGDCQTIRFDVMRSVGGSTPGSWDLAHAGFDLTTGESCGCAPIGAMYEGMTLSADARPATLIIGGGRLQFALQPPLSRLSRTNANVADAVFDAFPYTASVYAMNQVIQGPGSPAGYVLDDTRLWPISCLEEVTDDLSTITQVDAATFNSHAVGPALRCIQ